jgi:HD-like signal output (HDOD) protein
MHSRFQEYSERFEKGRTLQDRSLTTYENSRFGTTHTAAGKVMASSWKLPEALRTCILRHHDSADYYTEDQLGDATGLLAVLQLARTVCRRLDRLPDSYEWTQVGAAILKYLGLEEEALDRLVARAYESECAAAA